MDLFRGCFGVLCGLFLVSSVIWLPLTSLVEGRLWLVLVPILLGIWLTVRSFRTVREEAAAIVARRAEKKKERKIETILRERAKKVDKYASK